MIRRFYTILFLFLVLFSAPAYSDFIECQITKSGNSRLKESSYIPFIIEPFNSATAVSGTKTLFTFGYYNRGQRQRPLAGKLRSSSPKNIEFLMDYRNSAGLIRTGVNQWRLNLRHKNKITRTGRCSLVEDVPSQDFICKRAVHLYNGVVTWSYFGGYQHLAKNVGLDCGVGSFRLPNLATTTKKEDINDRTDSFICGRSTRLSGGKRIWDKRSNAALKYVSEAKKRGLSCGVVFTNQIVKSAPDTRPCGANLEDCYGMNTREIKAFFNHRIIKGYFLKSFEPFQETYRADGEYSISFNGKDDPLNNRWEVVDSKICYFNSSDSSDRGCASLYRGRQNGATIYYFTADNVVFAAATEWSEINSSGGSEEAEVPPKAPENNTKRSVKPALLLDNPLHIKAYGKSYHVPLLPNVIFFLGEIEDGDEQGFRRALRDHEIDIVVLVSPGGLIYNGLELANIIYDNNLATYVPSRETCASACSFMFFAGNPKVAHGRLGVHQFYLDDDKRKVAIGAAQRGTQLLVADIIQNLTDFGTPSNVFSKMFSTSDMYYFTEEEKESFSSKAIKAETITKINELLLYFTKYVEDELDEDALNGMPQEMKNSLIQLELKRIGCMKGLVDGVKGDETVEAIQLLSSKIGSNLSAAEFSNLFIRLNNTEVGACY